jgi:hypothetical protein
LPLFLSMFVVTSLSLSGQEAAAVVAAGIDGPPVPARADAAPRGRQAGPAGELDSS